MKARFTLETIAVPFLTVNLLAVAFAQDLSRRTALDDYVQKPDASYSWEITSTKTVKGMKTVIVDMVSQTWRTKKDVDRTEWRHWLTVSIPENVTSEIGLLMIGGGYNSEGPRSNERAEAVANATGTVVAELGMVPNQTLLFHNDGAPTALKLTTNVKVLPDTLPFAGKPSTLPTSVTLVCSAKGESAARQIVLDAKSFAKNQGLAADGLTTQVHGNRCYLNWLPNDNFRTQAKILTKFLAEQQCDEFAYRLESDPEITLPPAAADML